MQQIEGDGHESSAPKSKSYLYSIPPELRLIIYKHLFAGEELVYESREIHPLYDRTQCTQAQQDEPSTASMRPIDLLGVPHRRIVQVLFHIPPSAAILLTCKLFLREALSAYYRHTTYEFVGYGAFDHFLQHGPKEIRRRVVHIHGADLVYPHNIGYITQTISWLGCLKSFNIRVDRGLLLRDNGLRPYLLSHNLFELSEFDLCDRLKKIYDKQGRKVDLTLSLEIEFQKNGSSSFIPCLFNMTRSTMFEFWGRREIPLTWDTAGCLHINCGRHHCVLDGTRSIWEPCADRNEAMILVHKTTLPHPRDFRPRTPVAVDVKESGLQIVVNVTRPS